MYSEHEIQPVDIFCRSTSLPLEKVTSGCAWGLEDNYSDDYSDFLTERSISASLKLESFGLPSGELSLLAQTLSTQ